MITLYDTVKIKGDDTNTLYYVINITYDKFNNAIINLLQNCDTKQYIDCFYYPERLEVINND